MKTYKCPECGETWENEVPETCQKCGCTSDKFIESENNSPVEEQIYYQSDDILITSKLWSFDFTSEKNINGLYFPTKSISAVCIQRYRKWWVYLLLGILFTIYGFYKIFQYDSYIMNRINPFGMLEWFGYLLLIVGVFLCFEGFILSMQRRIMIYTHNSQAVHKIEMSSGSKELLNAMLKCLKENT